MLSSNIIERHNAITELSAAIGPFNAMLFAIAAAFIFATIVSRG